MRRLSRERNERLVVRGHGESVASLLCSRAHATASASSSMGAYLDLVLCSGDTLLFDMRKPANLLRAKLIFSGFRTIPLQPMISRKLMTHHQCFEVVVPENSVVHAVFLALEILQYCVKSTDVTVACSHEALRVPQVSEPAPGCDEGGEEAVFPAERHAVITVQRFCDRLPLLQNLLSGWRWLVWRPCKGWRRPPGESPWAVCPSVGVAGGCTC